PRPSLSPGTGATSEGELPAPWPGRTSCWGESAARAVTIATGALGPGLAAVSAPCVEQAGAVWVPDRPPLGSCLADFSTQVNSSSLNSPTGRGSMAAPSLHPSLGPGIGSSLGSPGQLHSPISTLSPPINGMGPPFSVISSPMGPHSMSVPTTPTLGFGTSSPQVSAEAGPILRTLGGSSPPFMSGKPSLRASGGFGLSLTRVWLTPWPSTLRGHQLASPLLVEVSSSVAPPHPHPAGGSLAPLTRSSVGRGAAFLSIHTHPPP
uniref:retinoic acid receptor RXR-beta-like n=1 Tax=Panthera onca TaxID=9690 RepID=UPI002955A5C2